MLIVHDQFDWVRLHLLVPMIIIKIIVIFMIIIMIINLIWSGDWVRLRLLIFLPLLRFRCQSNQTSHSSYLHLSSYIYVTAHLSYLYQSYSCCPPCLCWRLLSYFSLSTHQSYLISSYSSCPPCLGWRLWLLSAFVTCTTFPPLSLLAAGHWSIDNDNRSWWLSLMIVIDYDAHD